MLQALFTKSIIIYLVPLLSSVDITFSGYIIKNYGTRKKSAGGYPDVFIFLSESIFKRQIAPRAGSIGQDHHAIAPGQSICFLLGHCKGQHGGNRGMDFQFGGRTR